MASLGVKPIFSFCLLTLSLTAVASCGSWMASSCELSNSRAYSAYESCLCSDPTRHCWVGTWGEGWHSIFLCQLYGSHSSRLLVTFLAQGSPSQRQDESEPSPQTRQVLEDSESVYVPRWWPSANPCPRVVIHKVFNLLTTLSPTVGQYLACKRCLVSVCWLN